MEGTWDTKVQWVEFEHVYIHRFKCTGGKTAPVDKLVLNWPQIFKVLVPEGSIQTVCRI